MAVVAGAAHSSGRTSLPSASLPQMQRLLSSLNHTTMHYIKKYDNRWTILNKSNGKSRPLTQKEVEAVLKKFPILRDSRSCAVRAEVIEGIENKP
jgi:hypothetical protein